MLTFQALARRLADTQALLPIPSPRGQLTTRAEVIRVIQKAMTYFATAFFALIMIGGAIAHVVNPDFYAPFVPEPIPLGLANIASTIVEGIIGVLLLVPKTRRLGALAFAALLVALTPIHIWDLLKEQPAVGSHAAAVVRLIVQAVFIAGGLWLARRMNREGGSSSAARPEER